MLELSIIDNLQLQEDTGVAPAQSQALAARIYTRFLQLARRATEDAAA